MARIELKHGQENYPVQPQAANIITAPGTVPPGSKTANIFAIHSSVGYHPECRLQLWGKGKRKEYELDPYGNDCIFDVDGYSNYYFSINPLPGKDEIFSFNFHFEPGGVVGA